MQVQVVEAVERRPQQILWAVLVVFMELEEEELGVQMREMEEMERMELLLLLTLLVPQVLLKVNQHQEVPVRVYLRLVVKVLRHL
jgi:hypothetical protein